MPTATHRQMNARFERTDTATPLVRNDGMNVATTRNSADTTYAAVLNQSAGTTMTIVANA